MAAVKERGDEKLYKKLESAYPNEDDSEVGNFFPFLILKPTFN